MGTLGAVRFSPLPQTAGSQEVLWAHCEGGRPPHRRAKSVFLNRPISSTILQERRSWAFQRRHGQTPSISGARVTRAASTPVRGGPKFEKQPGAWALRTATGRGRADPRPREEGFQGCRSATGPGVCRPSKGGNTGFRPDFYFPPIVLLAFSDGANHSPVPFPARVAGPPAHQPPPATPAERLFSRPRCPTACPAPSQSHPRVGDRSIALIPLAD